MSQSSDYPAMFRIARKQTSVASPSDCILAAFGQPLSHASSTLASAASQQQAKPSRTADTSLFFSENEFVLSVDSTPGLVAWEEELDNAGSRLRPSEWVAKLAVEFQRPWASLNAQRSYTEELLLLLSLPRLRHVRLLLPSPRKGYTVGTFVQENAWAILQLQAAFDLQLVEGGRQDRTRYLKPPTQADETARVEADRLWREYKGPCSWIESALDEMGWRHDCSYDEIVCRLTWRDRAEVQRLGILAATDVEMTDAA